MKNVYIIASNVIRDAVRQKLFYVVFLFAIALVALSPMLPTLEESFKSQILIEVSLSVTSLFGLILTLALCITQINGEITRKTVYNLFSKPVSRLQYIAGKYVGIMLALAVILLILGLEVMVLIVMRLDLFAPSILLGVFVIFLECAIIAAFCLVLSTITKPAVNAAVTLLFYFFCHMKSALLFQQISGGGSGGYAIIYYPLYYMLPNLENFNVFRQIGYGEAVPVSLVFQLTLYAAGFVLLFGAISYLIFRKKDI
ncbi:MAG: ABC transporter permease subunit [Actinobacteria bacterium]|nr:ABC transporter permease subunit [Actinomycetota bacterium]